MPALTKTEATLPSKWYLSADVFAAELDAIWYRDWVCIGRSEDVAEPGDFITTSVGSQNLIVVRSGHGSIRGYHNTCRHRGSLICTEPKGRFRNGRIICPYHTWTYSLEGDLLATPYRQACDEFSNEDFPLYSVPVDTWGGFVFVNLSEKPTSSLAEFLGDEADNLANWPLEKMITVRRETIPLACNWKIFWENYCECYHCPRVHPELCKVVPVYKEGVMGDVDLPEWEAKGDDDGRPKVADGMTTWSEDGQSQLPIMKGLSALEMEAGANFASFTASMFVVAHPDYVRSVRIVPEGPEATSLVVDWLLLPDVAKAHAEKIDDMTRFGRLVVEQDGAVCELNQRGLRSMRHEQGVLVPQEHYLHEFHDWVKARVGARVV